MLKELTIIIFVVLACGCSTAPPIPMTCVVEYNGKCIQCEPAESMAEKWGMEF